MSRTAKQKLCAPRQGCRLDVENLEGRSLLASSAGLGFLSAIGIGATGPSAAIHSNAVATDAAGDSFITGSFRGNVALDPSSTAGTFTTDRTQDTFVAKYSPTGSLLWARTFAGLETAGVQTTYAVSQGSALAVDGSGNVFVAGSFDGTVLFGAGSGSTLLSSPSKTEPFVAKIDSSGNLIWAVAASGTVGDDDETFGLALDGAGGAVIAGSFADSATFGSTTLTAGGASEGFAARVDAIGHFLWAVATKGSAGSNAQINGVAVDGSGNVDLAGLFSGTVDFDPGVAPISLVAAGSDDAVLWKIDSNGHFLWARPFGSPDFDIATAIAVDASGDLLATGAFSDTLNFGTGSKSDPLTAGPVFNGFVIKVDPIGNEVWARGLIGSGGWSKGQGIAVDPSGNAEVVGTFSGTIDFDPGSGTDNLTSGGSNDVFVEGLDGNGNLTSAVHAGQTNFNAALGVAVNASDIASVTGTYSGTIAFGSTTVPAIGQASVFVAQVQTQVPPPPAPSSPHLEAASDTGTSQTDGITATTAPVFDVLQAIAGDTVELLRNGVMIGQRNGPGAIQDPGPLAQGSYTYTAVQLSPSGTAGPASAGTMVTILTGPPPAPAAPSLLTSDDTGLANDGITSDRLPHLVGMATANAKVQILDATGAVIGTGFAGPDGSYSITPTKSLADGTYLDRAQSVDVAGNVGPAGPAFTLTILATPPAAPSLLSLLALDDSGIIGDNITNVKQPRLTGSAVPGLTVEIENAANAVLGMGTAMASGGFTLSPSIPLPDGTYVLHTVAVDAAGNVSAAGKPITLTILATPPPTPASPSLLAADDTGVTIDGMTSVRRPRVVGTAAPGGRIDWISSTGSVIATTTASTSIGSYTLQPATALPNGAYTVRIRETDIAGNVGATGPAFNLTVRVAAGDSFGDSRSDIAVFRPSDSSFYIQKPTTFALVVKPFGIAGDVPVSGDFFGNGHADVAVYRPSTSTFYATDLVTNVSISFPIGQPGDVPVPADYDDDGKTDFAVFRPGNSTFYIQMTGTNTVYAKTYALPGDIPVPADYFGNGHAEIAVYRPTTSTFYLFDPITNTTRVVPFGQPGGTPVPADYEGLGHADIAVYQPGTSTFSLLMTNGTTFTKTLGLAGDIPVPGDYFGDGHTDIAVFRPSTATFYAFDIATGASRTNQWGTPGLVKPTLAPITTWFKFNGTTISPAIAHRSAAFTPQAPSTATFPLALIPLTTEPVPSAISPVVAPSTHDRAIAALDLEGWRVGL